MKRKVICYEKGTFYFGDEKENNFVTRSQDSPSCTSDDFNMSVKNSEWLPTRAEEFSFHKLIINFKIWIK